MGRTVAAVLADGLARAGVGRLFAVAGAPPALTTAAREAGIDVVDVSTAYGGVVMAAATGEVTERPGAAWVPLGGTVTLVREALAAAARDHAPMIVITEPGAEAGQLAPVVRASVVADAASTSHWIAHAARAAMNEPRGPAHLAVGDGALAAPAVPAAASCRPDAPPTPPPAALHALAHAIGGAQRPLVVTGLGCRTTDAPWIRAFAESVPAPVLATPKGKGALPDPHRLALGAWSADHAAARRADLVVALGVTAGEIRAPAWPDGAVAVTRAAAADTPPARLTVIADIATVLEELAPRLREGRRADWDVAEVDRLRRAATAPPPSDPFSLERAVVVARELTPAGTPATFDGGLAERWQAVAPHECLVSAADAIGADGSGDARTGGYALPAAIAAALARGRPVVAFATCRSAAIAAEWKTATRLGVPLVVVTAATGVVTADGVAGAGGVTAAARAGGVPVTSAANESDFRQAFAAAWRAARPALVCLEPPP